MQSPYPREQSTQQFFEGVRFEWIGYSFQILGKNFSQFLVPGLAAIGLYLVSLAPGYALIVAAAVSSGPNNDINLGMLLGGYGLIFAAIPIYYAAVNGLVLIGIDHIEGQVGRHNIFSGFRNFLSTFCTIFLFMSVTFLGFVFCFIPGLLAVALFSLAPIFSCVDRLNPINAMRKSFNALKPVMWPALGYVLVSSLIGGAGFNLCLIGGVFTLPAYGLMMACLYLANRNAPVN